jgi:hypothetical protein
MRQVNILGGQEIRQQRITVFLLKRNTELRNYQTNAINVSVAIIRKGHSRSLCPESNAIINILKVALRKSCAISILVVTACLCLGIVWALMGSASNRSGYFAFLAFSALYFAHRAFVAFEILARPVADIVRLRFILLRLTIGVRDGA